MAKLYAIENKLVKIGNNYLGELPAPVTEVTIGSQVWSTKPWNFNDGGAGIYTISGDYNASAPSTLTGTIPTTYLYTAEAINRLVSSIPEGWHLPTEAELNTLWANLPGNDTYERACSVFTTDQPYRSGYAATNASGLDMWSLYENQGNVYVFDYISGKFWTGKTRSNNGRYYCDIYPYNGTGYMNIANYMEPGDTEGYQVRLIKDSNA